MAASSYRKIFKWNRPFSFTLGGVLPSFQLAYETWGRLNEQKSNAVVLFTGLSGHAHAKSHGKDDTPGWWEAMIGPGKALDSNRFFIVCFNYLGGCFGSTGPASLNPKTGKPYGPDFPPILLQDIVEAVKLAIEGMGISRLYATVGASMGGMVALEYAARFAKAVERTIMISASGRPGPQSISYRFVQRQVIMNDRAFCNGWYYDNEEKPYRSMAVARQIGNITYRSRDEFNERFGRSRTGDGYNFGPDFQVESYLHHMGTKLGSNFDPNSFLFLSKAMDLYSLGYGFPSYESGVARIEARALIIGVDTDMLFPVQEQKEVYSTLVKLGKDADFSLLESASGHDAFLVEVEFFEREIQNYL